MEENVDSIKENSSREDDSLTKDIIDIDSPKTSTLINTNTQDPNKEKVGA